MSNSALHRIVGVPALLVTVLGTTLSAAEPLSLRLLPDRTNAICALDLESLFASPKAKSSGWTGNGKLDGGTPPLMQPRDVERVLMGARIDYSSGLESDWEITDIRFRADRKPPAHLIARFEGGYEDAIDGVPAIWTQNNAYVVDLGGDALAMVHPADRQEVARWVGFAKGNTSPVISPYLQKAAERLDADTQFVLALDVENALAWPVLLSVFSEFEAFSGARGVTPEAAAKLAATLKGVTLTASVGTRITGQMLFEFGEAPTPLVPIAKPLLQETLSALGAPLEDTADWRVATEGNVLVYGGVLSEDGLRRLGSILEPPTSEYNQADESADLEREPTMAEMRDASKAYFEELEALIFDIDRMLRTTKNDPALWLDRYATKIDRLPLLNVDTELLEYAASVSATFRQLSNMRRQTRITAGVRKGNITANSVAYQTYYNLNMNPRVAYGYDPKIRTTEAARTAARKQEDAKYYGARFETFASITTELENVRRDMTQKYKVEFGSPNPERDAIRRRPSSN